ncbi:unnamed protein product [Phaedon cochleariae]|uniref:Major facilitator superfamily (MFS) profile domain-containing protein n=1 Tax=Phaedon cochleariae TaxID=80249 RepID=A0A9N9SK28_PHACE|nr:unnamed protein product [Phaedon cochleariae]
MDDSSSGVMGTFFQLFASVIANLMAITDGMTMGWTAPMIPYFLSEESHIKMTRSQAEWLESCILIGAILGLPFTIYFVEKIGRRKSLILSTALLIICWVVIAVGDRVEYLYAARLFKGLGLNMAFVAAPMYVGEIAHKKIRGFLSSITFVMMLIGVLLIYGLGPFVPYFVPSVIAGVVLLIECVVFYFLPESPYYLMMNNEHEAAKESLKRFRGKDANIEEELKEITETAMKERNEQIKSLKELYQVKNYRKALQIMFILNFAQLFSSFEVIMMNLHEILESAGSIYMNPSIAAIIFAAIMLVSAIVAAATMDSFGRKVLLVVSCILTGICLLVLAIYFNVKAMGFDVEKISWIPIASVMVYAAVFKVGLGMVPIVMTAEIFASKIKAIGMTAADGAYVLASIIALQVYFNLKSAFGIYVPFYIFSGCAFSTSIYVVFFVPETKGKSLEDIQRMLRGRVDDNVEKGAEAAQETGESPKANLG